MIFDVLLSIAIIILWTTVSVYGFSFYASSRQNHYKFSHLYQAGFLNIFQSLLGIYFIVTGDDRLQSARWITFSFLELVFLYFILRSYNKRHIELIVVSLFMVVLLLSTLWLNLIFNIMIVAILVTLSILSKDRILSRWFSVSFILYGFTSIIPSIYGFTQTESLLAGLIFSLHFMIGVRKIYHQEKIDDELKKKIIEENSK